MECCATPILATSISIQGLCGIYSIDSSSFAVRFSRHSHDGEGVSDTVEPLLGTDRGDPSTRQRPRDPGSADARTGLPVLHYSARLGQREPDASEQLVRRQAYRWHLRL